MTPQFTSKAYQTIIELAWSHILSGGGIVPDDGAGTLEDSIAAIACELFQGSEATAEVERSLAGLDAQSREQAMCFVWTLVNAFAGAAFTFGAAVAIQLHHAPAAGKKGGRS